MGFYQKPGGTVVVTDSPIDGAGWVELSAEQYRRIVNPTVAEQRQDLLASAELSSSDKRKALYETIKYKLVAVTCEEDTTQPFFDPPMTVDGLQLEYAKYVGDDDDYAASLLVAKKAAKDYIRLLVGGE
ncbi:MAG: hypothetical protein WCR70_00300 [Sphaerochaetaceae bacterium]